MVSKVKVLAAAGLGLALSSRAVRSRLAAAPEAVRDTARRRRLALPRGVQEFPSHLEDRRGTSSTVAPGAPVHPERAAEVAAAYYEEHPVQ